MKLTGRWRKLAIGIIGTFFLFTAILFGAFIGAEQGWIPLYAMQTQAALTKTADAPPPSTATNTATPSVTPTITHTPRPTLTPTATLSPTPYTCNCRKTCGEMSSCDEAYFQLEDCGCSRRDGDKDGVPCESICPGG